ncbi:MAG: hypothetical protein QXQ33_00765 [Nitrososphaerota archaeon]
MSLRKMRFDNDYFIEVSSDGVVITNRRSMSDFYERLKQLLTNFGIELKTEHFDPNGEDWP